MQKFNEGIILVPKATELTHLATHVMFQDMSIEHRTHFMFSPNRHQRFIFFSASQNFIS
jgi:hypothetical protein